MDKIQILDALRSTQTEVEWNAICDAVKEQTRQQENKDYPDWWYKDVIASGISFDATNRF